MVFNASGEVAFDADTTAGEGIWAQNTMGQLTLIAFQGEPLQEAPGQFLVPTGFSFSGGSGNEDGLQSGFNDLGQIAFYARGVSGGNNISGIFISNAAAVPEPSTCLLAAIGAAGLGYWQFKRRRGPKMLPCGKRLGFAAAALILACCPSFADAITISWSTVGDPGNAPDTAVMSDGTTGYGSVPYVYRIGTYDVTTGQYAAFLNAVAATDPYGVYSFEMNGDKFGISQSGSSGNYSYAVHGNPNVPMFEVTWGDAARFANWLQNGQPTGAEGPATTEAGAYTLNGAVTSAALLTITRNPGATTFLPSENEWYKAAYYKSGGTNVGYWTYPTKSNTSPINILSATGTNNANFFDEFGTGNGSYTDPVNYLTPVGAFADSPGPYGTFDMGGDVFQWNEAEVGGITRGLRAGAFGFYSNALASSARFITYYPPAIVNDYVGFRVASLPVPEPSTWLLATIGMTGLWFARRRRRIRSGVADVRS